MYSDVLLERERIIKQQSIFKIIKVGQYWHQKRVMSDPSWEHHVETIQKRKAFLRWYKHKSNFTKTTVIAPKSQILNLI